MVEIRYQVSVNVFGIFETEEVKAEVAGSLL